MKIKSIVIAIMMLAFTAQAQFMHTKWNKLTSSVADSTGGYIPFANGVYWRSASSGKFLWQENGIIKGLGVQGTGTANQIAYFTNGYTIGSLNTSTYPSLTELSYLKGVTSSIQTQLNTKVTNPMTTLGDIIYGGSSGTPTRLGIGTNAYVLTVNSGVPSWQPSSAGITNSSATNEIPKTNASGNLVASGLESTSAGDLTFGLTTTSGTTRSLGVAGSSANIGFSMLAKGEGDFTLGTSATSNTAILTLRSGFLSTMSLASQNWTFSPFSTNNLLSIHSNALNSGVVHIPLKIRTGASIIATGIGTGLRFDIETATSNFETMGTVEVVTTDLTSTSEDADMIFRTMAAGASAAERVRFASTGAVGFNGANYGTSGQVLTSNGPTSSPSWIPVTFGGVAIDTIQIGDWDMDTDATKLVNWSPSYSLSKIRDFHVTIRSDADAGTFPLSRYNTPFYDSGISGIALYSANIYSSGGLNVNLGRVNASVFDGTDFNTTSFNRGWIIIFYVP